MATKNEIVAILGILSASFPRFSGTQETARVYEMLLKDIPGAELKAAALQCAAKCDFFPSVHELRQEVISLRRRTWALPSAAEAWQNLIGARGKDRWREVFYNPDGSPFIDEQTYQFLPMVEEVARTLGWPQHFGNEMADRAHFMKEYERRVNEHLEIKTMLPEVKEYIEASQKKMLEAQNE